MPWLLRRGGARLSVRRGGCGVCWACRRLRSWRWWCCSLRSSSCSALENGVGGVSALVRSVVAVLVLVPHAASRDDRALPCVVSDQVHSSGDRLDRGSWPRDGADMPHRGRLNAQNGTFSLHAAFRPPGRAFSDHIISVMGSERSARPNLAFFTVVN